MEISSNGEVSFSVFIKSLNHSEVRVLVMGST